MNIKNLNIKIKTSIIAIMAICVSSLSFVSCGDEDKSGGVRVPYDPNQPVVVTGFKPDSGRIAEKVIFEGRNFGTDPNNISVYFNQKKAQVVGSTGNLMYVVVPRMPGDTCTVTVRVGDSQNPTLGKDSVVAEQKFRYRIAVSVSTVAGDGTLAPETGFRAGDLSYARLRPRYLAVDDDGNIFAAMRDDGYDGLIRINEKENIVEHLGHTRGGNAVTIDRETGIVTLPADSPPTQFHDCYPSEGWAVRSRDMKLSFTIDGGNAGEGRYKHAMAFCPWDGKVYTRFRSGDIAKIDPKTYITDWVCRTPFGDGFGLAFHPEHPTLLYMTLIEQSGINSHSVCVVDVSADPENAFRQLSGTNPAGGFRDGKLENALFNAPCQLYFDDDGTCYIADRGNHCIRKITPENMVETVVGVPKKAGFKDGNADEALFNQPFGIGVARDGTVYVADWGNLRVRKLTIE